MASPVPEAEPSPADSEPGPEPFAGRVRYLDDTRPGIAENLALDEALLVEAEEGTGPAVLRVWEPSGPAIVLGASCRLAEDVDAEACARDGVPIARRSSGGGTVVVGPGTLNAAIVLPRDAAPALGAVDTAQRFVLARWAAALREAGRPVVVLGLGDLTVAGRKVAGSAQRRLRRHVLVHVTILYGFPIERVGRYLRMPKRQPSYRAGRPHAEFLANLDLPRARILEAVRSAWIPPGTALEPAEPPLERARALVAEKYGDPAWVARF